MSITVTIIFTISQKQDIFILHIIGISWYHLQVEDFPIYLKDDHLLMHGDVAEVDPRNWESKNLMYVFLFEEFIVFTICNEYKEIQ